MILKNNLSSQMFVRLFVDENLDRHVPISKQPKEKIQVNASTSPNNSTTMTSLRRKVSFNGTYRQSSTVALGNSRNIQRGREKESELTSNPAEGSLTLTLNLNKCF